MKRLKRSLEELEADSLALHASRQERSKVALRAVAEMLKHPLSAEQMRAQIERNHRIADRYEKQLARTEAKNEKGSG
jgi:uncharacterized membrane protein YccC